jgi:hypothetical protein
MRTIKTTTGATVVVDGDPLSVVETLYLEVTARREFERSFDAMHNEISHLVSQLNDQERVTYLEASLFQNSVTYENGRVGAYVRDVAGSGDSLTAVELNRECQD